MRDKGQFIARRLAGLVITLFAASIVIYAALYLAPGDPAALLVGGNRPSPTALAHVRDQYHLDDPFLVSYWHWLTGLFHGDLGQSLAFKESVSSLLASRLATTIVLIAYASLLILGIGIGLGIWSALRGGRIAGAVTVSTTVGMAAPTFVAAVFLISIFAVQLGWFPVLGGGSGFADRLWHLTLPAIALALAYVAYIARITRAAIADELDQEFVETARVRGIPERLVIRRHVVRNAAAPIIAVSGLTIAGLIAGTVVVEQAFSIDGVGSLLVESAARQDFAVVQAISLLMVAAFVIINTVGDLASAFLDPRLEAGVSP